MGYGSYTVYRNGQKIEAGYNIEDVCNKHGCTAEIDRGLDHLCGETPGGDEHGCGGYFCGEHLYGGWPGGRCKRCLPNEPGEPDDDEYASSGRRAMNRSRIIIAAVFLAIAALLVISSYV